mgnify:CR=1 FL=1
MTENDAIHCNQADTVDLPTTTVKLADHTQVGTPHGNLISRMIQIPLELTVMKSERLQEVNELISSNKRTQYKANTLTTRKKSSALAFPTAVTHSTTLFVLQ